jgi:Putative bacterial sensory transduction regulator
VTRIAAQALACLGVVLLCLLPSPGSGQERGDREERGDEKGTKTLTSVSDKQLEQFLKDLKVDYKPFPIKKNGELVRTEYDLPIAGRQVTIQTLDKGKVIVIGVTLKDQPGATLASVNDWNVRSVLSRAILRTGKGGAAHARLEWDLDCELGVSSEAVAILIRQFDSSVQTFEKALKKNAGSAK